MAGTQGIRAGKAYVELGAEDSKLLRGLRRAQARLRAWGTAVQGIGLRTAAVGAAMLAPFIAAVRHFNAAGDALDKMSKRTGVSVEALSEIAHAADTAGTSLEAVEGGIRKMQRTITDAAQDSQSAVEALAALGLTAADLKSLKPEDQFEKIARRISAIPDPTRRAAAAMEVLGKSATELLPLLESLEQGRAEARMLGLTIPEEAATRAADLNDAIGRTVNVAKNAAFWVGDALAPALSWAADAATRVLMRVRDWMRAHPRLVAGIAGTGAAVLGLGAVLVAVGTTMQVLAFTTRGLSIALSLLAKAFRAAGIAATFLSNPIGMIVGLVLIAVAAILHITGALDDVLSWIGKHIQNIGNEIQAIIDRFPSLKTITGQVDLDFEGASAEVGRLAVAGTFSGAAARQLAGGSGSRLEKLTEKEIKVLEDIHDEIQGKGAVFW